MGFGGFEALGGLGSTVEVLEMPVQRFYGSWGVEDCKFKVSLWGRFGIRFWALGFRYLNSGFARAEGFLEFGVQSLGF